MFSKKSKCKIFGHRWKGDSQARTCQRCGQKQIKKYSQAGWIDVDETEEINKLERVVDVKSQE